MCDRSRCFKSTIYFAVVELVKAAQQLIKINRNEIISNYIKLNKSTQHSGTLLIVVNAPSVQSLYKHKNVIKMEVNQFRICHQTSIDQIG